MTRERVPLRWAMTQMNLGAALQALSERGSRTVRLEDAVVAYDRALEVFSSSRSDYYEAFCRSKRSRTLALIEDRRK